MAEPAEFLRLTGVHAYYGASHILHGVDFAVRPWCETNLYWAVRGDILENAKFELEAAGCSIPYPQRDVHMNPTNSQEQNNGK